MPNLNGWDIALLAGGAFICVVGLVRLMRLRRDRIVADLKAQLAHETSRRKKSASRKKKKAAAVSEEN